MAFDLSNFSVPQEGSCHMQLGWQCDFYFGYGIDVMEEDAMNEKYCIQVLRILITKADTEIDELEKDLVFLQNELAWVEYEEWSEICCNALRKQISYLYIAVRSLKSKDKNDIEVRFMMYRKPLKRLHELLKALLRDYCNDKDKQNKQPLDVAVLGSSDSPEYAAEQFEEKTNFIDSNSSVILKEESQASCITSMENDSIQKTSLTHQENKKINSEAVKLKHANVKDSSPNSLKSEANDIEEKEVFSSIDMEIAMDGEAREHFFTPAGEKGVQDLSLKSTDQPGNIVLKNSGRAALKHAVNHSNKKNLTNSNSKVASEESEEKSSASTEDVIILNSSLNPMGKSAIPCKRVKLINTVAEDIDSNACTHAKGHHHVMTTVCKSDLEVSGDEEVSTHSPTAIGKNKNFDSSSCPEGKVNPPKGDKPANAIVQDSNADDLRHATGVNGSRNNSDSRLATSKQAKVGNSDSLTDHPEHTSISRQERVGSSDTSVDALRPSTGLSRKRNISDSALATSKLLQVGNSDISPAALRHATSLNQRRNDSDSKLGALKKAEGGQCDIDQKLCDFAQKGAHKRGIKECGLTLADKLKSSYSSSEAKGKGKPSLQIIKGEKSDLTDTEQSALTSTFDLQDDKGKKISNVQPQEGKMPREEIQVVETIANNGKFNTDLPVKPQKQYVKRKVKSNTPNIKEPGVHSVEMIPKTSFISKAKRQWKSEIGSDTSGSNQSLDQKIMKKTVQRGCYEAEEDSIALDDSQNSVSQPQKRRKTNLSLPVLVEIKGSTLQMDFSKSHRDLNTATGKDDISIPESYSIDCCTEVVTSSPFATSKLKELKIGELRAIAKEQKLTKYYKLRKNDLVERIAHKLGSC